MLPVENATSFFLFISSSHTECIINKFMFFNSTFHKYGRTKCKTEDDEDDEAEIIKINGKKDQLKSIENADTVEVK